MSCNGCRILRKGCTENCSIKPCLQWIDNSDAQANATFFLAKFYGRAGLLNLLNAGPDNMRPEIFKSLMYEACGRIVNPISGSAGLLSAGNWKLCQDAVDAVLAGTSIVRVSPDSTVETISPPLKACDIRHVAKEENSVATSASASGLHKVNTRGKFKRSAVTKPRTKNLTKHTTKPGTTNVEPNSRDARDASPDAEKAAMVIWSWSNNVEVVGSPSHDSSGISEHEETVEDFVAKSDESDDSMDE